MNKRYKSVAEMVRDISADEELAKKLEKLIESKRVVKTLISLRIREGKTQKQVAEHMGCSQSRISKLESGEDKHIRLGDILKYLEAIDMTLEFSFKKESK